jgi:DNA-binding CsgD family transcriptional regulator
MKELNPLNFSAFKEKNASRKTLSDEDCCDVFSEIVRQSEKFAIGPFYYFVASFADFKIKLVSDNVQQLSQLSKKQWMETDVEVLFSWCHPDDVDYLLASYTFVNEMVAGLDEEQRTRVKANIYLRYLNASGAYGWTQIQPWLYVNTFREIECGLYMCYELSHLSISSMPYLSIINFIDGETQYFARIDKKMEQVEVDIPSISKREKEILLLMAKGFNTPQVAERLCISYHTVENHKRNLRQKTDTRTSAELVAFAVKYNLVMV